MIILDFAAEGVVEKSSTEVSLYPPTALECGGCGQVAAAAGCSCCCCCTAAVLVTTTTTTTHCRCHLLLPERLNALSNTCRPYFSTRTSHMQRAPPSLALFLAAALLQLSVLFPAASASCLDDAPYPDWAHAHWIWQSGGELTQQGADAALLVPSASCRVMHFLR